MELNAESDVPQVLALDAMGVIYSTGDDLRSLLIPFVERSGCSLGEDEIAAIYRKCLVGAATTKDFWEHLGLGTDQEAFEQEFIQSYSLDPEAIPFLDECCKKGIVVACLTNDVSNWSRFRRERFGLHHYIQHWVVSGEVGCRKPDPLIYQALIDKVGAEFDQCWFVDDREPNVEAAARLGMRAVLFNNSSAHSSSTYTTVNGFRELRLLLGF
ncbi:MAG: HAD-IA family hydrolase [Dehalococcoidia bacterium]